MSINYNRKRTLVVKKWRRINSKYGYSHPFFKVREDHVILPSGLEINDYTIWESGDVAQVVPVRSDGTLLLVQQYKHGLGEVIEEFPGGFIDKEETPLEAAKRELSEETGFSSKKIEKIGTFIHHPTKEVGKLHLFIAYDIEALPSSLEQDITEDITIVYYSSEELLAKIKDDTVMQTGSMLGLMLYLQGKK